MYNMDGLIYDCPVEALSSILGKKWVAEIVWIIQDNEYRYGELLKCMKGCSKKMLNQQLDILIKNNVVINDKRTVKNTVISTYYLSEAGLTLLPIMKQMIIWGNKNLLCGKKENTIED